VREREAGRGRGGIRRRKKGGEKRRIWRPEGRKNSAFFPLYLSLTVPERLVRVVEPRVPSCLVLVLLEPAQGARGKVAHFLLQRIGDAAASSGKKKKESKRIRASRFFISRLRADKRKVTRAFFFQN